MKINKIRRILYIISRVLGYVNADKHVRLENVSYKELLADKQEMFCAGY